MQVTVVDYDWAHESSSAVLAPAFLLLLQAWGVHRVRTDGRPKNSIA